MGTKMQLDSYLPGYCLMRDLNHDSDDRSWNLPIGQYYCSLLPRSAADSLPGANKDILKQAILQHEAIFKNQVFELHRLYRVQKDLMDEIQRKDLYKQRIPYEASSLSSLLPSQLTSDNAHRRNSSSFLFGNSVCDGPPVLVPEIIQSSAGSSLKGKNVRASSIPLQCGSPKDSESRPTKVRKMIDLQLPADEYIDTDEVEQQNGEALDSKEKLIDASRSDSCLRKPSALADLNEPVQSEEISANPSVNFLGVPSQDHLTVVPGVSKDFRWNSKYGNMNGTLNNFQYNSKGNEHHWFSSVVKEEGSRDSGKSIYQTNHIGRASMSSSPAKTSHQPVGFLAPHPVKEDTWSAKTNGGFKTLDRTQSFSSYRNREAVLPSQPPSYDHSWGRRNGCLSQKPLPVQASPYLNSASLSKSPPSSVRSNEFHGNGWHMNNHHHRSNSGSSYGFKELPAQFGKAAWVYVNGSCNDKACSGSSNFLKGSNSLDLNSTGDLNCLSCEPLAKPGVKTADSEVKREDPLSVLPWLRPKATNEAGPNKVAQTLNHQNSVASTSCAVDATRAKGHQRPSSGEEEIESGRRKRLLDINVPCDEPEDSNNAATMSEIVPNTENGGSRSLLNMIDLNSCVIEDEIPAGRAIIDLEAPIDLETEEDNCIPDEEPLMNQHQLPLHLITRDSTDSVDRELARVAAEAIIAISCPADNHQTVQEASGLEDALLWFADIVCSYPDDNRDCLPIELDCFEEMTLKLTECTVEEYFPSPPVFNIPMSEEMGPATVPGRTRRGPPRRGRQRRDFQRDILPGLTSLARHEVTEDLQTFGGLMRATGHAWHCGTRRNASRSGSSRGRRRPVVAPPPPLPPSPLPSATPAIANTTGFASQKHLIKNGEIILENRSLTSWGKTTRRPRRQRCAAAAGNLAPIALT